MQPVCLVPRLFAGWRKRYDSSTSQAMLFFFAYIVECLSRCHRCTRNRQSPIHNDRAWSSFMRPPKPRNINIIIVQTNDNQAPSICTPFCMIAGTQIQELTTPHNSRPTCDAHRKGIAILESGAIQKSTRTIWSCAHSCRRRITVRLCFAWCKKDAPTAARRVNTPDPPAETAAPHVSRRSRLSALRPSTTCAGDSLVGPLRCAFFFECCHALLLVVLYKTKETVSE